MKYLIGLVVLFCGMAHGQSQICDKTASVNITAAGISLVAPANTNTSKGFRICGYSIQVTQGATAANYTLEACSSIACTSSVLPLSPVMQGHASTTDNYSFSQAFTQVSCPNGDGIYINLSSAPTMATVQIYYGYLG